ncbi:MAG: FeoB-associated Cys-rich membrane protein [Ruminococcus sp.]|nr:FeoB-associated Cys-rich membrane protein [Ruminococcus sp.]
MNFITENAGTILVGLIVLAVITAIILKIIADKKKGKSSCGCGCENCPSSKVCHGDTKK